MWSVRLRLLGAAAFVAVLAVVGSAAPARAAAGYGVVEGRITTQSGDGIGSVFVELRRNGNWWGSTGTDETGGYRFTQVDPDGAYTLRVRFASGQEIWYDNASSEWTATAVPVVADTTTTIDIVRPPVGDLVIHAIDAVTDAPVAGYCFYYQGGPLNFQTTCTDATGKAHVADLPVGDYEGGGFDSTNVYVNGHFDPVTVPEGGTGTAVVRLEKTAKIRIEFTDAVTGAPVSNGCVALMDPVRNSDGNQNCTSAAFYMYDNLFPHQRYRLFVTPQDGDHGAQWVSTTGGGTGDPAEARVYETEPGEQITVTVKLDGAGDIVGTVRSQATDATVESVCPSAIGPWVQYGGNGPHGCTWSDGNYGVRRLGPYRWKLSFAAFDGQHAWAWSGNAPNRAQATPVQVVAGQTVTLDVDLPATGRIEGTVTVSSGPPARWTTIYAVDATTGDYAGVAPGVRDDGTYSIRGLNTTTVALYVASPRGDLVRHPTDFPVVAGQTISGVDLHRPD